MGSGGSKKPPFMPTKHVSRAFSKYNPLNSSGNFEGSLENSQKNLTKSTAQTLTKFQKKKLLNFQLNYELLEAQQRNKLQMIGSKKARQKMKYASQSHVAPQFCRLETGAAKV